MNTHAATTIIKYFCLFIAFSGAWSGLEGSDDPIIGVAPQSHSTQTPSGTTRSDLWTLAEQLCEAQLKVDNSRGAFTSRRADRVDELHATGFASWREAKESRLKADVAKHRCLVRQKMLEDLRTANCVIEPLNSSSPITMEVRIPGQSQPLSWISTVQRGSLESEFCIAQFCESMVQCFQFDRSNQLVLVEIERLSSRLVRMKEAGFSEDDEEFLVAALLLQSLELQVEEEAARRKLIEAALYIEVGVSDSDTSTNEVVDSGDIDSQVQVATSLDFFQQISDATGQRHALAFAMRQHSEHRLRAIQQLDQSGYAKPVELRTAESEHELTEQMFLQLNPASVLPLVLRQKDTGATDCFFSSLKSSLDSPAMLLLLQYREREVDLLVNRFELERRRETMLELQEKLTLAGQKGGSTIAEQETTQLELEGLAAMLGVVDQNLSMWRQARTCVALISSRRLAPGSTLHPQQELAKRRSTGFLATTLAVSPIDSALENTQATSLMTAVKQLQSEGFASQAELDQVNTNAQRSSLLKLITQDRLRAERTLLRMLVSTSSDKSPQGLP